jgi:hypothetical protein
MFLVIIKSFNNFDPPNIFLLNFLSLLLSQYMCIYQLKFWFIFIVAYIRNFSCESLEFSKKGLIKYEFLIFGA